MVVVLAPGAHGLIAGSPLAELDALHEPHAVEQLEGSVDARDADVAARLVKCLRDLVCREAAALGAEHRDHGPSGTAGPVAPLLQRRPCRPFPAGCSPVSHGRRLAAT